MIKEKNDPRIVVIIDALVENCQSDLFKNPRNYCATLILTSTSTYVHAQYVFLFNANVDAYKYCSNVFPTYDDFQRGFNDLVGNGQCMVIDTYSDKIFRYRPDNISNKFDFIVGAYVLNK
jgi:hypothetical protein